MAAGGNRYADGKYAVGECARSGRKMLLKDMVADGYYPNLLVDPAWREEKHPQEYLPMVDDPQGLYRPSPNRDGGPTAPVLTAVLNVIVPTLSAINPSQVEQNSGSFTMTLTGSNFLPGGDSTVYVNGNARATTYNSDTELEATVLNSDIDTIGQFEVEVRNSGAGAGVSNIQALTVFSLQTFTADGTLTIPAGVTSVDLLIVGGGGAGGGGVSNRDPGGGGGAGEVVVRSGFAVSAGDYPVVVGAGGTGSHADGEDSSVLGLTALGGGGGGVDNGSDTAGNSGGSGGGASRAASGGASTASDGVGFNGGNGFHHSNENLSGSGGGGGAGGSGANGVQYKGGDGGDGIESDISGTATYYGGGGGGASNYFSESTGQEGSGGLGGGGNGAQYSNDSAQDGTANTGGGGGGASALLTTPGNGGSGIVIVRISP